MRLSFPHPLLVHYWYEVGMLKVPAIIIMSVLILLTTLILLRLIQYYYNSIFREKIRAHLDLLSIPRLWGKKCVNSKKNLIASYKFSLR